jgi:hypothetical protein
LRTRLPLGLLIVILIAGAGVRSVDLGRAPFTGDGLDHYYAAQSLRADGGPALPSGEEYRRALDYTKMVELSLGLTSDPEVGARLPSAIFGILCLLLLAPVAWKIAGPWAAVWCTLLLAVYPEAIGQSRISRFYTYQMAWGIVAMYAGWRTVSPARFDAAEREPILRTWMWAMVACLAFVAALRVQVTTASVFLGWGVVVAIAAAVDRRRFGRAVWKQSAVWCLAVAGSALVIAGLIFELSRGMPLLDRATFVAAWARVAPGDSRTYYWALAEAFPLLMALTPLVYVAVALRHSVLLALFLGLWFGLPLVLHSFILPWKGQRYIFMAIPGLLMAGGIAATAASGALQRAVTRWLDERGEPGQPGHRWTAATVVAMVALFAVVATPAVRGMLRGPPVGRDIRWPVAVELLGELPMTDTMWIGSSVGLLGLYYFPRADFVVGTDFLERSESAAASEGSRPGSPQGSAPIDWYSGLPVLTTPSAIRQQFPEARTFAIAIDLARWIMGNVDPALREVLTRDGVEICQDRCGNLLLYVWRLPPDPLPAVVNSAATASEEGAPPP